jgi:EamA domain-containing membrane protein RarD
MKEIRLSMPELALIAGTRAAFGAGAALLLGDRLTREQKKAVGWTLLLVGVVTTVPLLANVIAKRVKV